MMKLLLGPGFSSGSYICGQLLACFYPSDFAWKNIILSGTVAVTLNGFILVGEVSSSSFLLLIDH